MLLPPSSFTSLPLPSLGLLGAYTVGTYVNPFWDVSQFSLSNESSCGDKKSVIGKYWPVEVHYNNYCLELKCVCILVISSTSFSDTPSSFPSVAGAISDGTAGGCVLE